MNHTVVRKRIEFVHQVKLIESGSRTKNKKMLEVKTMKRNWKTTRRKN